jgi:hypothetical protein
MTLKPFSADDLDQLALRILDISSQLRQMSAVKRGTPELELAVHEKKALEWLAHLEDWAADARTRLEMARIKHRGTRAAGRIGGEGRGARD